MAMKKFSISRFCVSCLATFSALVFAASITSAAPPAGTVSGVVYSDKDNNGLFSEGDSRSAGSEVCLIRPADKTKGSKDEVVACVTTNETGEYQFENVEPGSYQLQITYPGGLTVLTSAFVVTAGGDGIYVAIPVVDRAGASAFSSLRVAGRVNAAAGSAPDANDSASKKGAAKGKGKKPNPANTSGRTVSAFAP